MLELKKPGLYIANGKNVSVLVKIVGTAPMLDVVSGVLLNDMEKDGTVTVLGKDDILLQDIVMNPQNYVFDLPSVSEAIKKDPYRDEGSKDLELSSSQFEKYTERYKNFRTMYPNEKSYEVKMIVSLMQDGFSKSQADIIINQIKAKSKLSAAS